MAVAVMELHLSGPAEEEAMEDDSGQREHASGFR